MTQGAPAKLQVQKKRGSLRSFALFSLVFVVSACAGLVVSYPVAGVLVCARCFGFEALADNIFVERGIDAAGRANAIATMRSAREKVRGFYGTLLRTPRVLICATEPCYARFADGESRGSAFYDRALILAPGAATPVIAAHELSHIELHARIGVWRASRDIVPRWFDEGLAVNVSDDPLYLRPGIGTARCRVHTKEPLPVSRRDWLAQASGDLYAIAACRVSEWLAAHGGTQGILALAERIAQGETFEDAMR